MFNKLYNLVKNLTTSRNLWIFAITVFTLSVVMLVVKVPDVIAGWMGYSGSQSMFAPDSTAFAAPGTAYSKLAVYGEEGRKAYFYNSVLFDLIYPINYSLLLATGFTALLRRLLPASSAWQKLGLFWLLAGIFDLLENFSIYIMLANYPNQFKWLDILTAILTTTKGLLSYTGYLLLLSGLLVLWVRNRLNRSHLSKQFVK